MGPGCTVGDGFDFSHDGTRNKPGGGTGTATLDAKLSQEPAGIAHEPLLQVFIDVHKAYNSLDRGIFLEVLRGYGMVPNLAPLPVRNSLPSNLPVFGTIL